MDICFSFFCIGFVSCCCLLLLLLFRRRLLLLSSSLISSDKRSKKRDFFWTDNMNLVQHLLERLRSVISLKGWDYCVLWKLSEDQRFLEWVDCCCAGSDPIIQNGAAGEQLIFPVSSLPPCRDVVVQHPRTKPCHLLAQLPSTMPLDSGIYAQTLMSNQPTWLNFSSNLDSNSLEETDGTRVLIPVPIGLVELFVAKHVPAENREITNYVAAQCNIFLEQEAALHCSTGTTMESAMMSEINTPLLIHSASEASESPSLPYDVYVDRIRLSEAARSKNDGSFFEELNDHFEDQTITMMMMESNNNNNTSSKEQQQQQDKGGDSIKMETGRSESISDCSEEEDDDDAKHRRRTGKGPQSKNLMAERKRRKKLNDKLYALRALVPKISKLDRASILGDAIEFVKELQKQVKDLQNELEEQSGDNQEGGKGYNSNGRSELILDQNGIANHLGLKREDDSKPCKNMGASTSINSFAEPARPNHDSNIYDKRQMEPQVEVVPLLDGNEFFVKVFSEFKTGGFVRLMESLDFLGLEVTNVNVNRFISLVSYVFKVEKRDSEMVQADHVRDSLLEITRNPTGREWSEMTKLSSDQNGGNNGERNYHDHDHRQHQQGHHITTSHHQFLQHQQ